MAQNWIAFSSRAAAGAAALFLVCGADALAAGKGATYTVTMSQMRYGPLPANLKVGDTIVWVNKDTVPHTVTAKDRKFDVRIASGKRASQTLTTAGTFPFYCIYHPAMRGTLKVGS
jgi:plastocyanin